MMYICEKYHELLMRHSDPRVEKWTFMGGFGTIMYISIGYLLLVLVILPAIMKNREPLVLTTTIRIYNISQVVLCCLILYTLMTSGWIQGEYSLGCQTVDYSNSFNATRQLSALYWTYILKMYELVETVFFVLRKKYNQVSPLHLYHHVSTLFIAYVGTKFIGGGMFSLHVQTNLLIHIFMYTYYYLSSFGPEWQKSLVPWKSKLTIAQMVQFTLMLIHSVIAFLPGCAVPKTFFYFYVPNIFLLYKMFYDFYKKTYAQKSVFKVQ
ncbi:unnamed protein product [Phaedon cochleariae]|uniref:Elongation of very long chain fatty acids protein n=1 Tax=Phaedon cochleariae TaxID=80249 RepID=A0A9P0GM44_PHACE|nr:unnamed protein product [Phaedon cochleariae]